MLAVDRMPQAGGKHSTGGNHDVPDEPTPELNGLPGNRDAGRGGGGGTWGQSGRTKTRRISRPDEETPREPGNRGH